MLGSGTLGWQNSPQNWIFGVLFSVLATIDKNMFWNSFEQIWYETAIIGITTEIVPQVPGKTTNTE